MLFYFFTQQSKIPIMHQWQLIISKIAGIIKRPWPCSSSRPFTRNIYSFRL